MNARVLVVDDEIKLANIVARYLEATGYGVTVLNDGNAVLETVAREQTDIVLLDWLLPGVDGLTLCQQLRASSNVSIIMMTARVDESDRVAGLDNGADDYICKPFSLREVAARVRALMRRLPQPTKPAKGIFFDEAARRVLVNGSELALTQVEYRLLKTLTGAAGRVFTRDELLDDIYKDNRIVTDRTIDVHIKNLRHKLENYELGNAIATVYGAGYRWQEVA